MLRRFAVVVVVLLAAPAFAESRWGLTWRAPDSCIGPGELAQAVEAQLKRPLFAKDPQVRVEGSLQAGTAPRWRARFSLVTAAGEVLGTREIDADEADCRAIDKRLVLAMALAIEPELNRAPPAERAPVRDAPPLAPGSVQVHLESDNREARLLRLAGTSYGTGVSGGRSVTVAVTSFAEECRAPCDRPVERADDRFYVGGSGVTMSPEFTLLDHAKDGRVDVTVKAGSAGGAALGTFLTTIGFAGLITGGTLAVVGAVGSSSGSIQESLLVSGLITAGVGVVLTAIGFPVLLGNRTRLTFGDGTAL